MRVIYIYITLFLSIAVLVLQAHGQDNNKNAQENTYLPVYSKKSVAIKGYDTVAYFIVSKPVKGKKEYSYQYKNVLWYFSTQEHRSLFINNPQTYEPQYGGYCAYAMANDYIAPSDTRAWTIYNGKLYLNYSIGVKKTWEKKKAEYIINADKNWKKRKNILDNN